MSAPERYRIEGTGWLDGSNTAVSAVLQRVRRALRVARVGLCFAYFGIGTWLMGAAVIPLSRLLSRLAGRSPEEANRRIQRLGHRYFRSFMWTMTHAAPVARVEWVGAGALARGGPRLIVANHPSLIDSPLLATKLPQADFIVGPEWTKGFMRRAVEGAGYLHAGDGARVVSEAVARLRAGRTVVVYPEGSRTPREGRLRPFQRGAAHIALEAGCDLLPIVIHVTPRALMQGERWTDYPDEDPLWRVEVGEPIPVPAALAGESRALAARRLTGQLQEHFEKRWESGRI